MKDQISKLLCAVSVCILLMQTSCREDTILNADIVPPGDTVTVSATDSITILTKTVLDDSLITSQSLSGYPIYHALGTVTTDPYFGKTHTGIAFQVVPPSLDYKFPKAPDSAFLILPYAGYSWGDTSSTTTQTFKVYKLTDTMSKDSNYYNFTNIGVDRSNLLGSAQVNYKSLMDSVTVSGTNRNRVLKIKLSSNFVNEIYTESAKTTGSALQTYPEFMRFMKGLYLEADTNQGNCLHYFRLDGSSNFSRANIIFFYTQDSVKTTSFYYTSTYNAHYNRIVRKLDGTTLGTLLNPNNTSDSVVVIQNGPGAVADLKFPYIKNLPKLPINKAELIITQYEFAGDNKETYYAPERIYPVGVDKYGAKYNILDRYPLSSSSPLVFMDGTKKTKQLGALTVHQYILNIPREVQRAIVEQRDTLHLRISGAATYSAAHRLIAVGDKTFSNNAMSIKLNIVYSKQ